MELISLGDHVLPDRAVFKCDRIMIDEQPGQVEQPGHPGNHRHDVQCLRPRIKENQEIGHVTRRPGPVPLYS